MTKRKTKTAARSITGHITYFDTSGEEQELEVSGVVSSAANEVEDIVGYRGKEKVELTPEQYAQAQSTLDDNLSWGFGIEDSDDRYDERDYREGLD